MVIYAYSKILKENEMNGKSIFFLEMTDHVIDNILPTISVYFKTIFPSNDSKKRTTDYNSFFENM